MNHAVVIFLFPFQNLTPAQQEVIRQMLPSHPIIAQLSAANSSQDNTRLRPPPPYEEAASSSRQGSVERGLSAERTLVPGKEGTNRVPGNMKQRTVPEINREPRESKAPEPSSRSHLNGMDRIQVPVISSEGQETSVLSQGAQPVTASGSAYPSPAGDNSSASANHDKVSKRPKGDNTPIPKLIPKPAEFSQVCTCHNFFCNTSNEF